MRLLKIYVLLNLPLILLFPSVWAAGKYILPVIPFLIIFLARGLLTTNRGRPAVGGGSSPTKESWFATATLLAILLCNFVHIGTLAVKQVSNNIAYCKGNRYAGYSEQQRAFFMEAEKLQGLPDSTIIISRKPEIVWWITHGLKGKYPWQK